MLYPNITNDLVYFLYRNQIIILAGIVVAMILAKHKFCWLAYLAGIVGQIIPMWEDYRYLAFNNYTHAMSGVIGLFVFVSIVGAIVIKSRRKKQLAKLQALSNVVFFCPNCGNIREGIPGEIQGCPVCHNTAAETEMLWTDWQSRSEEEQAYIRNYWLDSVRSQ